MNYYNLSYYINEYSDLIILALAMLITYIAQIRVKLTYAKYIKRANAAGLTGAETARRVLNENGVYDVVVTATQGELTDHFDPRNNEIVLSHDVYAGTSIAAAGVAAHEAGHAVQYAQNYFPIKLRAAIIPATNLGSKIALPLVVAGYFLSISQLVTVGIALFSLAVVFQLVTLPVEFNASRRAVKALENCEMLNDDELIGAKHMLRAAAMTYVAALFTSIAQLLRLISIFGGRRKND